MNQLATHPDANILPAENTGRNHFSTQGEPPELQPLA
jgi:hypothetical protein